jgi:hypothetical protein
MLPKKAVEKEAQGFKERYDSLVEARKGTKLHLHSDDDFNPQGAFQEWYPEQPWDENYDDYKAVRTAVLTLFLSDAKPHGQKTIERLKRREEIEQEAEKYVAQKDIKIKKLSLKDSKNAWGK